MNLWVQGQLGSGISGASFERLLMTLLPDLQPDTLLSLRTTLRAELRVRRRALTPEQQAQASQAVLQQLMTLPLFIHSQHIALYWAMDGEIDLALVAAQCWNMGKHCYLPVLHPQQARQLWFVPYRPETLFTRNRFNIPEPEYQQAAIQPAELLDLVLLPLVGFAANGARLGMGGGFYDTTFAFKQASSSLQTTSSSPCLFGVAHACQQLASLQTATWDIALQGVITDQQVLICIN